MLDLFFFKQKTAYEIGLGIPAEPLFRSLYSSRISLRGRSAASLRQNCVTVFSFSKNHFSSPSGRWTRESLISSWGSTLQHCANSSINLSVRDTNSSRTSEADLWPSTYISPLSNSTPCIRKDRSSSTSLMRLSICLWKPSIGD